MIQAASLADASTPAWREPLAQFQAFTIAHPHLVAAKDSLIAAIRESEPNSIVMVFGPTGVGKTTLRMRIEQILMQELQTELEVNRSRIPVASVEAIAPDSGSYCWRSYFRRLLNELSDPLADRRRLSGFDGNADPDEPFTITRRSSGSEYRYAVEQTLRFRKPAAVLIDEAQHLGKVASVYWTNSTLSSRSQTGRIRFMCCLVRTICSHSET